MSDNFADRLIRRTVELNSPVLAGLDPRPELLSRELLLESGETRPGLARAYVRFAEDVLDGLVDVAPAVKIQIAFYEALGPPGIEAYFSSVRLARERGFLVIGDIKRGDIGTSSAAYATAHFGAPAQELHADVDAVTLSPYLGSDCLEPFLKICRSEGRGAFALVRTSNPSAPEIQNLVADGIPVYQHVANLVQQWGEDLVGSEGYSSLGAVVGATYREELLAIRKKNPSLLLLVPGYGAQGGTAEDVGACLDSRGTGLLVASSRGILRAYREAADAGRSPVAGIREAAQQMRDEIRAAWADSRSKGD
ncbi:MAG: orotidine-5'-phosphate decarboxylase [Planctomycetota bacterium]